MNKLNDNNVTYLKSLIKTCLLCGIDAVAIEKDIVRGQCLDNSKGTFLLETENVLDTDEFSSFGIGRVKILGTRMAMMDDDIVVAFDIKEKDNGDNIVKKIKLSNKQTKLDFSCLDSARIKAPLKFKDKVAYTFTVTEDTLRIMNKVFAAINTTKMSFSNDSDGTIKFRTTDIEGDELEHEIADSYNISEDSIKDNFFFEYGIKYILPLFKVGMDNDGKLTINICNNGILNVIVNNFNIYVLPER
jgi:hypothetical protein